MSSNLMGVNGKWFNQMDTNKMSYDDIIGFVKEHEAVAEGGRYHKPILHSDLLREFRSRANRVGIELANTQVALSRDGMKIMCVSDTKSDSNSEYALSCGFRNSTNSTQSFNGCFGSNCKICSNGLISGLIRPSCQRNTINNYGRFGDKIDIIFDRFDANRDNVRGQIETMKSTRLTDAIVGRFVRALIAEGSIGNTHICNMLRELDNPTVNKKDDDSCYRLMNCGTWVSTHEIKNPLQGMTASRLINNTIMKIIKSDFVPLGDDILEAETVEV